MVGMASVHWVYDSFCLQREVRRTVCRPSSRTLYCRRAVGHPGRYQPACGQYSTLGVRLFTA